GSGATRSPQRDKGAVIAGAPRPAASPKPREVTSVVHGSVGGSVTGNSGPAPNNGTRSTPATAAEQATGIKLRGLNSNSSSSMARRTAATGVAKIAVMPPAAPATSSVFRSTGDRWNACANSDPNAPPVTMTGPSASYGPPVPIARAEDNGFNTATFGS